MSAAIIEVAEGVKDMLDDATLSQTFTSQRVYIPLYDTARETGLKVFIVTLSQSISDSTRGGDFFDFSIKLAVYKQVDPSNSDEVDAMILFVEEVIDLFRSTRQIEDASLIGVSNEPVYDPAQLDKFRTFVSVVDLNYRLQR